jgi:type II secretory pathway pseudopilin PulG
MKNIFIKQNKGFTLVETLVGLLIFTLTIMASMSVLGSSISSTNYAKQKIVAEYLAQEGIEYVRNQRDNYILFVSDGSGLSWDQFRDAKTALISPPQPEDTTFSRSIQKIVVDADQIKIISSVSWMQGSGLKTVTFSENLFNWVE